MHSLAEHGTSQEEDKRMRDGVVLLVVLVPGTAVLWLVAFFVHLLKALDFSETRARRSFPTPVSQHLTCVRLDARGPGERAGHRAGTGSAARGWARD